jgi:hypothetical protein
VARENRAGEIAGESRTGKRIRKSIGIAVGLPLVALASAVYTPQVLAFPYKASFGDTVVRSERPLPADFAKTIAAADALVANSALYRGPVPRSIFLTKGGWRWRLISLQLNGTVAFRRPLSNLIVVNDADPAADSARNHIRFGGIRTLHDTIAHETTHILITDHFGLVQAQQFPRWKVEGYADYIAGTASLSDVRAALVRRQDPYNPALAYYDGRKRVAAVLARDPNVDHLFLRP